MWLWDGTDREEGDGEAAFADAVRRAMISEDPSLTTAMRRFVAAFAVVLTGRKGDTLVAPEPMIQGGFTPSGEERDAICRTVARTGRDIVHICFRTVAPYTPTGLIVVAYLDGDRVRLHSRTSLLPVAEDGCIRLYGVEDEPDLNCHFRFMPGSKLVRVDGHPTITGPDQMREAAAKVEKLIGSGLLGDVAGERLTFYHLDSQCGDVSLH